MTGEGRQPDWELAWEVEQREVLSGASFSVFAPEGLRVELSGWGGGDGEPVDSVTLRHELGDDQWIEVDSAIADDEFYLPDARRDAAELLEGLTDAPTELALRVDGVDLLFAFASAADRWVAIGSVGDVTITVQARGIDAADLRLRGGGLPSSPSRRRSRTSARRRPALLEAGSSCW